MERPATIYENPYNKGFLRLQPSKTNILPTLKTDFEAWEMTYLPTIEQQQNNNRTT